MGRGDNDGRHHVTAIKGLQRRFSLRFIRNMFVSLFEGDFWALLSSLKRSVRSQAGFINKNINEHFSCEWALNRSARTAPAQRRWFFLKEEHLMKGSSRWRQCCGYNQTGSKQEPFWNRSQPLHRSSARPCWAQQLKSCGESHVVYL